MITRLLKAMFVGCTGSLVMLVLVLLAIQNGIAPFNLPPAAAFLARLGVDQTPFPLLLHFGYGAFWSVFFILLFRERTSVAKGLGLGVALWLLMMLVYCPLLGWGVFGSGSTTGLSPQDPLYHVSGWAFLLSTLIAHLVYGGIVGWFDPRWLGFGPRRRSLETRSAEL
jgi:hypothetical protein